MPTRVLLQATIRQTNFRLIALPCFVNAQAAYPTQMVKYVTVSKVEEETKHNQALKW